MKWFVIFLIKLFLTCDVLSKGLLRSPHTVTITPTIVATSRIPSSCVKVDENLPPCRTGRTLNIFSKEEDNSTQQPAEQNEAEVHTTTPGWGEYFGIFAPTVTVTAKMRTTYVVDPKVVVTYSIQGCNPTQLAVNFSRCSDNPSPIVPTQTLLPVVAATDVENFNQLDVEGATGYRMSNINSNQVNNYLEASNEAMEDAQDDKLLEATDPLLI